MSEKKGMKVLDLGPTGIRVAENVAWARQRLNLSYAALESRLQERGHRIPALGLRRIEAKARRVDVDDLLALAFALELTPMELLTPVTEIEPVTSVPNHLFLWEEVKAWISGQVAFTSRDFINYWESEEREAQAEISKLNATIGNLGPNSRVRSGYEEAISSLQVRVKAAAARQTYFRKDFENDLLRALANIDD